jgi:lysozyme family protein
MAAPIIKAIQQRLNRLGFGNIPVDGLNGPQTRTAVARFQLAYNLGRHLDVDGQYGPFTLAAIDEVEKRGKISPNFGLKEVRSKGDGTAWVHRDLLVALEALRGSAGKPLAIVSGWRDVAHNKRVGGATSSQHTYGEAPELLALRGSIASGHLRAGRAADFNRGYITLEDCRDLNLFSGIGWRADRGKQWVTHVDVRTSAETFNPKVWQYK